jgi:hypothetical protein
MQIHAVMHVATSVDSPVAGEQASINYRPHRCAPIRRRWIGSRCTIGRAVPISVEEKSVNRIVFIALMSMVGAGMLFSASRSVCAQHVVFRDPILPTTAISPVIPATSEGMHAPRRLPQIGNQPPRESVDLDAEMAELAVRESAIAVNVTEDSRVVPVSAVQPFMSPAAQYPPTALPVAAQLPAMIEPETQATDANFLHEEWNWRCLPGGLIYKAYLAGPKESRLGAQLVNSPTDSNFFDSTLGAHVGILRYGNSDRFRPSGVQLDFEGSAQLRQDIDEKLDVRSTDYRAGIPLTWGDERQQFKLAWYHISSHLGDEFFLKNPTFPFFFQSSDFVVLGYSLYVTDPLRLYVEAAYGYKSIARDPWEFQVGFEWAPRHPTDAWGAPFVAANGYLRQELDYGGSFTFQAGWAWRSPSTAHLFRLGFHYYNGASYQYAFLPYHEALIGAGIWYDF